MTKKGFGKTQKEISAKYYQDNKSSIMFNSRQRIRLVKIQCVQYLGGSCILCGYSRCMAALEFHHVNPASKLYEIGKRPSLSLEKQKPELDKCVLLCANCHREVESGFIEL